MPEVSFDEALRQIERLRSVAADAERTARWVDAVAAWRAVLDHPCAHHLVAECEVLDDIHQVWRRAGRWDDAIRAKRDAIAAGYRSTPDPEADIAECLLLASRRAEADALFAELRERDADDVWLYNSAGFAYLGIDDRESLAWSLAGIDVAFRTGDPDRVVMQLLELAERAWDALGERPDRALVERVEAFCESWAPPPPHAPHSREELPADEDRACAYCGYDPERSWEEHDELTRRRRRRALEATEPEQLARLDRAFGGPERSRGPLSRELRLAVGWFPRHEWAEAIERWPDLLDDLPEDHRAYSHAIEARIKHLRDADPGRPMHISPITVADLDASSAAEDLDAGSAEARAKAAAEVLRLGNAMTWPPGRNDQCWCGSGGKYKKCCSPIPASADWT